MHPVLIQIGSLEIRWYGAMIALACLVGYWLAGREAERKGIGKEKFQEFFLYGVIGAVIGARLYYVAFSDLAIFWKDPLSVLAIWEGGLAIHGALLGGLLVSIIYTRRRSIPITVFLDTLAPPLILGQAIGRIGCFFNGDAHGYPTTMPWGLVYSSESLAGQMFPGRPLHPTQLYEMILNLIIFGILWKIRTKLKLDGQLFLIYVILYSGARIFVEHFRADKLMYLGNISTAQSIGILGILVGIILIINLQRKRSIQIKSELTK